MATKNPHYIPQSPRRSNSESLHTPKPDRVTTNFKPSNEGLGHHQPSPFRHLGK